MRIYEKNITDVCKKEFHKGEKIITDLELKTSGTNKFDAMSWNQQ